MRRVLVPLVLLALLAAASPAAGQSSAAQAQGLVTSSDGRDVAAFGLPDGGTVLAAEQRDGSFAFVARTRATASRGFPFEGAHPTFALAGGDDVVAGYEHEYTHDSSGKGTYTGSLGGALFAGRPEDGLGPALRVLGDLQEQAAYLHLGANRRGDAVAAVSYDLPGARVITRQAGGPFRRPVAVLPRGFEVEQVVVGEDGGAVILGDGARRLEAVTVRPDGRSGRRQRLRDHDLAHSPQGAAVAGQYAVAWLGGDGRMWLARRARGGERFAEPIALAGPAARGARKGPEGVALDGQGRALVVWQEWDGTRSHVVAVTVAADGRAGTPVRWPAPERNHISTVAFASNDRGEAVVARVQPGEQERTQDLTVRIAGTDGAFGPPVMLNAPDRQPSSFRTFAAMAPSGRASVLWSDAPRPAGEADRLLVTHLDAGGAAPPVPIASAEALPPVMEEVAPPLREGWTRQRSARVADGGRLRLRIQCRSWRAQECRGVVRVRRGGLVVAGDRYKVPAGESRSVPLRLHGPARRALRRRGSLAVEAVVATKGPRGAKRSGSLVLRAARP